MDAAIMDGKTLKAGAVADVRHVKNPISLAAAGDGEIAARFDERRGRGNFAKNTASSWLIKNIFSLRNGGTRSRKQKPLKRRRQRRQEFINPTRTCTTVASVALDRNGNLAAATRPGGKQTN